MRYCFKAGDLVRLNEVARRTANKATRTGVVVCAPRTGTQYQVKWEGATLPQLIHVDLLELVPPDAASGA